jgi:hypothetical protein
MARIEIEEGTVSVDASIVAGGLGIALPLVQPKMRAGEITSLYERGAGEDTGRHRITFYYEKRSFSVVVDAEGAIIARWTAGNDRVLRRES